MDLVFAGLSIENEIHKAGLYYLWLEKPYYKN
jgi:hypothetical protein